MTEDEIWKMMEEPWYKDLFCGPPRDPSRIPQILHVLKALWVKHPDQRLGQLIMNATRIHDGSLFGLEDDHLLKVLEDYLERDD